MQRVEAMFRAMLPRQAWVTRTDGSNVYVRFIGETSSDPESVFISTVAGVPVGTMGWVIRLGGKKGLFVATGISGHKPQSDMAVGSWSASTAGTVQCSPTLTFSDLVPGKVYTVKADVSFRHNATDVDRRFRPTFRCVGASTVYPPDPAVGRMGFLQWTSWSHTVNVAASDTGTIAINPAFIWNSGSVVIEWTSITASIH